MSHDGTIIQTVECCSIRSVEGGGIYRKAQILGSTEVETGVDTLGHKRMYMVIHVLVEVFSCLVVVS